MIEVFREDTDGLSREAWRFRETGGFGLALRLDSYSIERRRSARGRYSKAEAKDRWNSMDERSYYSGLKRPASIPDDVMREAVGKVVVRIVIAQDEQAEFPIAVAA